MKSKVKKRNTKSNGLQSLSLSIGDFIRYWGFRRVHGAIWAQLYLCKDSLSCTDLAKRLNLSKSLISPALDELCHYKLIEEVPAPNEKTKLYKAAENINDVIQHVLKVRESEMLKKINSQFEDLSQKDIDTYALDKDRLSSLGEMILAANLMLQLMLNQKDIMKLPMEFNK